MAMAELQVNLPCTCGMTVVARAADAGGAISCKCGHSVAVPNLSKLRTLAGGEAYVTNPVEAIRKAQRDGHSPARGKCLSCGSASSAVYLCTALCEESHVKQTKELHYVLRWLLLPWIFNIFLWYRGDDAYGDRQGHDVEVAFDLPVCDSCLRTTGSVMRLDFAKQLMLTVPLYRELLAFYPNLTLEIVRPGANETR
jgi:hypothetical protein